MRADVKGITRSGVLDGRHGRPAPGEATVFDAAAAG
jgi:hypothetical protein